MRIPNQDSPASRLSAEMADDQAWAASFATTTDEQWDRLAESVRREISAGEIIPIADIFHSLMP